MGRRSSARHLSLKRLDHQLPTPRDYLGRFSVACICPRCGRRSDLDLEAVIQAGQGDKPLIDVDWKCPVCLQRGGQIITTQEAAFDTGLKATA